MGWRLVGGRVVGKHILTDRPEGVFGQVEDIQGLVGELKVLGRSLVTAERLENCAAFQQ